MMKKISILAICLISLLVVGCQPNDVGNPNAKAPTQADIEAEIKMIDADTKMPPQAKAMRKAMLQRNGTGQKAMSKATTEAPAAK